MKRQSTASNVYRVFLRSARRSTIEDQRGRAAACVRLGSDVMEFHGDQLRQWYEHARPDSDILIVDQLELIAPPRGKGDAAFPTHVLGEVRGAIRAKGLKIVEAWTGQEPTQQRWKEAIQNVAHGRRLSSETARDMGRKGGEKKPVETIQDYWKAHPDHAKFRAIWRGADGTYADAFEAVNAEARKCKFIQISSVTMAFRVFGHRGKRK